MNLLTVLFRESPKTTICFRRMIQSMLHFTTIAIHLHILMDDVALKSQNMTQLLDEFEENNKG